MFPRIRSASLSAPSIRNSLVVLTVAVGLVSALYTGFRRVVASGSPSVPMVQGQSDFFRKLSVVANDIVYNPMDQTIYASTPSSAGVTGNSLIPINPTTGQLGSPVFVGSEPGKLAMSDDGHTMYVFLEGAFALRRFDTVTQTPGQQFGVGSDSFHGIFRANDFVVAPGNPNVVAVSRYY